MIGFIDDCRGAYGVEPICRVLKIAPSTYHAHDARRRQPDTAPPRLRRDVALRVEIRRVFDENFQVYGVRKVWRQLLREGQAVARCTVARPASLEAGVGQAVPVLLFLQDGDADKPVIVGFVMDALAPAQPLLDMVAHPTGATADGKRLQFEASEEVVLKCGKGSITLHANGRVVIKGTELVSRASGANKIRGASVNIN